MSGEHEKERAKAIAVAEKAEDSKQPQLVPIGSEANGCGVFHGVRVGLMFVLGCELVLRSDEPLTSEDVTDLIAAFVDELDELGLSPDVSTTGTGTEVVMNVEVESTVEGEMDAFVFAFTSIKSALHCAGVHTGRMVIPTNLRPTAPRLLQDA